MGSKPHEQLEAWKVAMQLVKSVYQLTAAFPAEERYGLAQQMRRAAVSIPSNIAEGAGRNGVKEYVQFIGIARGSLAELDTQLQIAMMLSFISDDNEAFKLADHAGKLLTGLHKKLLITSH
ncbi:MAG: four helix bundle protein [Gallionella sp.]|nr:four helix bundle protein [Gallionella sp.]